MWDRDNFKQELVENRGGRYTKRIPIGGVPDHFVHDHIVSAKERAVTQLFAALPSSRIWTVRTEERRVPPLYTGDIEYWEICFYIGEVSTREPRYYQDYCICSGIETSKPPLIMRASGLPWLLSKCAALVEDLFGRK